MKRVIWIVLDSVGIGYMPDYEYYHDEKSNTLKNVCSMGNIKLKSLQRLGIGNIDGVDCIEPNDAHPSAVMRAGFKNIGKDTITGHWEMAGVILKEPFKTYKDGFDKKLLDELSKKIGRKILGNKAASGTVIINELGQESIRTGGVIVYTSADSVFQIAAHEDVVPLEELYSICKTAREMLVGDNNVARVIARPFKGSAGNFVRTENRKDFAIKPPVKTALEILAENDIGVYSVGKIYDVFLGAGIKDSVHTDGNIDGEDHIINYMNTVKEDALIYANLVDFDMKYGHRNDVKGYADALVQFDTRLPDIMSNMRDEDILIICADHGCDPTTKSSDHSREYVPVIICGQAVKPANLGTIDTISNLGATVCDYLCGKETVYGESFLYKIIKT